MNVKTVSIYEPDQNNHYAVACSREGVFLVAQQKAYVYACVLNVADEPLLLDLRKKKIVSVGSSLTDSWIGATDYVWNVMQWRN